MTFFRRRRLPKPTETPRKPGVMDDAIAFIMNAPPLGEMQDHVTRLRMKAQRKGLRVTGPKKALYSQIDWWEYGLDMCGEIIAAIDPLHPMGRNQR